MAEKLGFFAQWLGGDYAERNAINANADTLSGVELRMSDLEQTVDRQTREILELRATIMGLAELLQAKVKFDDSELEVEVRSAWNKLLPPAKPKPPTDPYRGTPGDDATAEDTAAAKQLMRVAQDHHFSKRFSEARGVYQEVVDKYGSTKQAVTARQQIDNLKGAR